MKIKKNGFIGLQVIIILIVLIGFTIIYFFWLKDVRTTGDNLADYTICKNSNLENAKLKLKIKNQVIDERVGNRCKTEYLKVPKDQELNFMAKKLASCWDQYLEGKELLFETRDNTYCVVCSVLYFDDKDKEISDFSSYLFENQVPFKRELSYMEYLNRVIITDKDIDSVKNAELSGDLKPIATNTDYAVLFVQGENVYPRSVIAASSVQTSMWGTIIGGTIGFVLVAVGAVTCPFTGIAAGGTCWLIAVGVGVAAGGGVGYYLGSSSDPDVDTLVYLWPYNELHDFDCTRLEGQDQLLVKN